MGTYLGGCFTVRRRKFLYAFGALPADFPVQCVEVVRERLFHDRAYRPSAKFADELCPFNQLRRQCQRNVLAVRVRVNSWSWHWSSVHRLHTIRGESPIRSLAVGCHARLCPGGSSGDASQGVPFGSVRHRGRTFRNDEQVAAWNAEDRPLRIRAVMGRRP